jgi:hypothetical protein
MKVQSGAANLRILRRLRARVPAEPWACALSREEELLVSRPATANFVSHAW